MYRYELGYPYGNCGGSENSSTVVDNHAASKRTCAFAVYFFTLEGPQMQSKGLQLGVQGDSRRNKALWRRKTAVNTRPLVLGHAR